MEKIFKTLLIVLLAISAVLVLWGVFATPDKPATAAEAPASGYNLVWGYILLGAAVVVALFSAAMGLVTKPAGLKGALISLVAIVAIVVIAAVVASGHDYQIVDLQNSAYFGRSETVLTDTSILITYVAMAGAVIAAIYSAVADSLK